jgi:zinc transport system substrate-binding protein
MRRPILAAVAVLGGAFVSGCSQSPTDASSAPALEVVTGVYPLAQAAQQIGQTRVHVTDVVPAGADPRRYTLTPAQTSLVHRAGLVLEVGGGFQPSFEQAAAGAARVTRVDRFAWVDPAAMKGAVGSIAAAMEAADPAAAGLFREGATSFAAEVSSDGIDYQSTLSTCSRTTILTPDGAFASMAKDNGLTDVIVGTGTLQAAQVETFAGRVERAGGKIFSETWTPDDAVRQVALAVHAKVSTLDTMIGAPAGGWPDGRFVDLLEANLGVLSSALGCESQ